MAGEKGLNFVSTSHERGAERSFFQLYMDKLQFGYTYRGHVHSHPASPFPSNSDLKIKSTIIDTQLRNQKIEPFFSIYYVNKNDKQNLFNIYVPF